MIKLIRSLLVLIGVSLSMTACLNTTKDASEDDVTEVQVPDDGDTSDEVEEGYDLDTFLSLYFEAIETEDIEGVGAVTDFQVEGENSPTEEVMAPYETFTLEEIEIYYPDEYEEQNVVTNYFYNADDDDAKVVTVIVTGVDEGGIESEYFGGDERTLRHDLLVRPRDEYWEIIGSFPHMPLTAEGDQDDESGELPFTPEAFVSPYYSHLQTEEFDQIERLLADDWPEYEDAYIEDMPIQDAHVLMADVYEGEISEVVSELTSYTTDEKDYIVRVQYRTDQDEQWHTDDVLVSNIEDEWKILMIERYDQVEDWL